PCNKLSSPAIPQHSCPPLGRAQPVRWFGHRRSYGSDSRSAGSVGGRGEDAEFVALGIGEDDPGFVPGLSHIDVSCPEFEEAGHLGGLIVGSEVEVETILHDLLSPIDADE